MSSLWPNIGSTLINSWMDNRSLEISIGPCSFSSGFKGLTSSFDESIMPENGKSAPKLALPRPVVLK